MSAFSTRKQRQSIALALLSASKLDHTDAYFLSPNQSTSAKESQ